MPWPLPPHASPQAILTRRGVIIPVWVISSIFMVYGDEMSRLVNIANHLHSRPGTRRSGVKEIHFCIHYLAIPSGHRRLFINHFTAANLNRANRVPLQLAPVDPPARASHLGRAFIALNFQ